MTIGDINAVCSEVYGCGLLAIDSTGALWLAEHILDQFGANVFRAISDHRAKFGSGTCFPAFGSEVFRTM